MGTVDREMWKKNRESGKFHSTGQEIYLFLSNRRQEKEIDTETEIILGDIYEYNTFYLLSTKCLALC